ncbi:MAG: helix-turn-helix domain-containing protein [Candidatus Methanofastidiosia archaeon]
MRTFRAQRKLELILEISQGFREEEVYIPHMLGADIILTLIEYGENLKTIYVPPSIYEQTSERVKILLQKARVSLESFGGGAGRPRKYSKEDLREIIKLKNRGFPITKISKELGIPRRTIYHLLKDLKR